MSSGALTHPGELELIFDVIRRCELERLRGVRLVTPESAGIYAHLLIGRDDTAGAVFLTTAIGIKTVTADHALAPDPDNPRNSGRAPNGRYRPTLRKDRRSEFLLRKARCTNRCRRKARGKVFHARCRVSALKHRVTCTAL